MIRVLSWNLYHGRDFPPDPALLTWRSRLLRVTERGATHAQVNRPLLEEFARLLGGFEWDLALLQEAPPRWFRPLTRRLGASGALARTSRNLLPAVQWRLADLNPDLLASCDGGSNQLLVRGRVGEVRRMMLARRPERRKMLWARVELPEGRISVANVHASAGLPLKAAAEVERAAERAVRWADGDPLVFGGDLNLRPRRDSEPFVRLRERFDLGDPTDRDAIDHLLVRGLDVVERPRRLPPESREVTEPDGRRLRLSDHAPVVGAFVVRETSRPGE
ncbi:MAG TPA: endonuclease/exonuclease/phosphatase family protein [Thermoleophilaceae bacterium]